MKKYTRPNAEVVNFNVEDIITASGVVTNASDLKGVDADMYTVYAQASDSPNTNVSVFTW